MKKQYINKFFALIGFLVLAFVAVNMNACSKDKGGGNNNPYGYYPNGPGGNGNLGYFVSKSGDGLLELRLTYSTDGYRIWANGQLFVHGYSVGCSLQPSHVPYQIQTQQNFGGQYGSSGVFWSITSDIFGLPYPAQMTFDGRLTYSVDQQGNRRADVNANIPGCPTNFI